MKWSATLGCCSREPFTSPVLCVEKLPGMTHASRSAGRVAATPAGNAANFWLVWREAVWPMTSPVRGFNAAYREGVRWRRDSKPCFSARPGDKGRRRSSRCRASTALFSSARKTAAFCGGFRYRRRSPRPSARTADRWRPCGVEAGGASTRLPARCGRSGSCRPSSPPPSGAGTYARARRGALAGSASAPAPGIPGSLARRPAGVNARRAGQAVLPAASPPAGDGGGGAPRLPVISRQVTPWSSSRMMRIRRGALAGKLRFRRNARNSPRWLGGKRRTELLAMISGRVSNAVGFSETVHYVRRLDSDRPACDWTTLAALSTHARPLSKMRRGRLPATGTGA